MVSFTGSSFLPSLPALPVVPGRQIPLGSHLQPLRDVSQSHPAFPPQTQADSYDPYQSARVSRLPTGPGSQVLTGLIRRPQSPDAAAISNRRIGPFQTSSARSRVSTGPAWGQAAIARHQKARAPVLARATATSHRPG